MMLIGLNQGFREDVSYQQQGVRNKIKIRTEKTSTLHGSLKMEIFSAIFKTLDLEVKLVPSDSIYVHKNL